MAAIQIQNKMMSIQGGACLVNFKALVFMAQM